MLVIKTFYLKRNEDKSGVSGTGIVAVGVVLPSGRAVVEWLSFYSSVNTYQNLEHVKKIHGHEGKTELIMGDPPPEKPEIHPSERREPEEGDGPPA